MLREKYRYIKFKVISDKEYSKQDFEKHLRKSLMVLLGELGYSECLPKLVSYSVKEGIVKVLREREKDARTAIALITEFDNNSIHIQTTFVSGTIKGCGRSKT